MIRKLGAEGARIIAWGENIFHGIACVGLFFLMIVPTLDIILRYVLNYSIWWSFDFSEAMVVIISFLALAKILANHRHIRIQIFTSRLSEHRQIILDIIAYTICLVFFALLTWQGWIVAWRSFKMGAATISAHPLPLFPIQAAIPIGSFMFCLQAVVEIYRGMISLSGGKNIQS